jgi:hypothetical protein
MLVKTKRIAIWLVLLALMFPTTGSAQSESLDDIYKKAVKEGGTLNFYGTLAQINAAKILPVFEKRFPGIKINHVDATADKLAVRAITEARGGKVIADVFQISLENVLQLHEQKLTLDQVLPEAAAYPANMKGTYWLASSITIMTAAWNTNLVQKGDTPTQLDDFADPKWKGRLIGEPRDVELLMGLARHKFNNDEKAISLIKKIAANNVEFHKGHSDLAELLVAGQAAACITCYSHHYPSRIKKGEGEAVDEKRGLSLVAVDLSTEVGSLSVRGEVAWAHVNLPEDLAETLGERQLGVHLDAVLPVWRPRIRGLQEPVVSLGVRLERVDFNRGTFQSTGERIFDEIEAVTGSVSFRPAPGTVFRANYRLESSRDLVGNPASKTGGFQVGFATYF